MFIRFNDSSGNKLLGQTFLFVIYSESCLRLHSYINRIIVDFNFNKITIIIIYKQSENSSLVL